MIVTKSQTQQNPDATPENAAGIPLRIHIVLNQVSIESFIRYFCVLLLLNAKFFVLTIGVLSPLISYSELDCIWGEWVEGECSATCGNGQKISTRTKDRMERHGGNCTGSATKTESCNVKDCPPTSNFS